MIQRHERPLIEVTMKLQNLSLILLLAMLAEFIETREALKLLRPYKYYRSGPRSHKPRWQSLRRPPIHGTLKKHPTKHAKFYHRGPPSETWDEPDYAGNHVEKEPYTIEIELPNRHGSSPWINRNYGPGEDFYNDEEDYLEEFQEFEDRVMQTVMKGVRIKVVKGPKPKLKIKLSRDDSIDNMTDSPNMFTAGSILRQNSTLSYLQEIGQIGQRKRIPGYTVPPYLQTIRRV